MLGFGAVYTVVAVACCAFGYFAADRLPREIRIGLVFLMPLYFVILLAGDVRSTVTCSAGWSVWPTPWSPASSHA